MNEKNEDKRLTADELAFVVNELQSHGHGKDGCDYEPECPTCTGTDKLKAMMEGAESASKALSTIQCTQCLAVTNEGNGCAQEGCPVGLKVTQGPRVLNALEVLEKAALGPESQGTAAQFLKCLGDSGMWVIENPLAPGVLASEAPRYFCKKCGYVGIPGDAAPLHERPNGTGQCGYMAVPMQAAAGVPPCDGGQQHE